MGTGFLIRILMRILDDGINQEVTWLDDGKIVLRMNKTYGIVGILSVAISFLVTIIAFLSGAFRTDDIIYALSMIAVFFLLGLLLVLYSRNIKVEANPEKIVYTGITGKSKEIIWNQVNTMSFNAALKEITLKSKETKIKLHIHLKGIGNLIRIIHENVDVSIYRQAFKDLGVKGF